MEAAIEFLWLGGVVCTVIFVSNPTTVLMLCYVVLSLGFWQKEYWNKLGLSWAKLSTSWDRTLIFFWFGSPRFGLVELVRWILIAWFILRKQNQYFGRKNRPFRPQNLHFEDFDAFKCNFLHIFAGMAIRVGPLTQYFGHPQVIISYGTKNLFWMKKLHFLLREGSKRKKGQTPPQTWALLLGDYFYCFIQIYTPQQTCK